MEEENNDVTDISNTEEETDAPETSEDGLEEDTEESVEEVKERLAKAEELANNYKIRAEKAERKAKEVPKEVPKEEPKGGISYKDNIALVNAKVHEDDVDEVIDYAKYKGISISEALKSSVIKTSLAQKAEERQTAEATNTSRTRGTHTKTSGEALLAKSQKTGEIPESDEDLDRLVEARLDSR